MASQDKYRSYMSKEDIANTNWIFGPPNYDLVNQLFEEGRTNIWPVGSIEDKVQRLAKTFEMELVHKANPDQYKTVDAKKCSISVNGRKPLSFEEKKQIGEGYNMFLQTSLPKNMQIYVHSEETTESSKRIFTTTFLRGFALEVLELYSWSPKIVYKFRHWGFMEGPFKEHSPTGEKVDLFGFFILELDGNEKIVKVEYFFDRGELLSGFLKCKATDDQGSRMATSCPFLS